jgi:hypothetical protein
MLSSKITPQEEHANFIHISKHYNKFVEKRLGNIESAIKSSVILEKGEKYQRRTKKEVAKARIHQTSQKNKMMANLDFGLGGRNCSCKKI